MAHDAEIKYYIGKQVDIGQRPQNTFNMNDRGFKHKKKKKERMIGLFELFWSR